MEKVVEIESLDDSGISDKECLELLDKWILSLIKRIRHSRYTQDKKLSKNKSCPELSVSLVFKR